MKTGWKSVNEPAPMGSLVLVYSRHTGEAEVCRVTREGFKMRNGYPFKAATDWQSLVAPDETQ